MKRKANKTVAIVLSSAASISVITGSILLSKEHITSDVFGGVSIPFWIASKKRKG